MKKFLRKLQKTMADTVSSITSTAEDPREIWTEPGEQELAGLRQLQAERINLVSEIQQLSSISRTARSDLELLAQSGKTGGTESDYAAMLRQRTEAHVDALDEQIKGLKRQVTAMDEAEARLRSRAAMLLASSHQRISESRPGATDQSAESSLLDIEGKTMAALNRTVDGARDSAAKLQARTADVFKQLTERTEDDRNEDTTRVHDAHALSARFVNQGRFNKALATAKVVDLGRRTCKQIADEYQMLLAVTNGRAGKIGHRSAYVVGLAAQTYDLGIRSLRLALEVLEEARVGRRIENTGAEPDLRNETPPAVMGHLEQARNCALAISDARKQLDMFVAGENEVDVRSATSSLRRAVEHAGAVQQSMNELEL